VSDAETPAGVDDPAGAGVEKQQGRVQVSEGASDEEMLRSIIGQPTGKSTVVVERGPVAFFADAVADANPIYKDPAAAKAAGLAAIPAPPTFPIAMEAWGKFPELQPADAPSGNPLMKVLGPLMAKGGLILHGEEEFVYHRPVLVGDELVGEGKVVDAYQKESKGKTMTFVVTETTWVDAKTGEPVVTSRFNVIHRA
jgi:acyl dehydratase